MFDAPLWQDNIWQNLMIFNMQTITSRLWIPWMFIVAVVLGILTFALRKQLRAIPDYQNLFEKEIYKFDYHKKSDWAALIAMIVAFVITAIYMYTLENSFFETYDHMSIGTTRSLKFGLVPNFDFIRITPFAFWNLSTLYAITQNAYAIKAFVLVQLLLAVWLLYCFFDYIPTAKRIIMLAILLLTPTILLTAKVIFPDREILIAVAASLICIRNFSRARKLSWLGWFLFFMNVAIYTKETCVLFYAGIITASILYNIWNEKICSKDFLHPINMIKSMPLEFLMFMSLFFYAVIFFILSEPFETNDYIKNVRSSNESSLLFYQLELFMTLIAVSLLAWRLRYNYNVLINPMFRGGLVVGAVFVAIGVAFFIKAIPTPPHLQGRSYYLMLALLFSTAYIFEHIRSRLILGIICMGLIFYSAIADWKSYKNEIGHYHREVAEFFAKNLKKDELNILMVIEQPQPTTNIDRWLVESWSSIYKYYFYNYKIAIKSIHHQIKTYRDFSLVKSLRGALFMPVVPATEPEKGDWVIIRKDNRLPDTLEIMKKLPAKPMFENKIFEVYYTQ